MFNLSRSRALASAVNASKVRQSGFSSPWSTFFFFFVFFL